jgi:hypothetical protein
MVPWQPTTATKPRPKPMAANRGRCTGRRRARGDAIVEIVASQGLLSVDCLNEPIIRFAAASPARRPAPRLLLALKGGPSCAHYQTARSLQVTLGPEERHQPACPPRRGSPPDVKDGALRLQCRQAALPGDCAGATGARARRDVTGAEPDGSARCTNSDTNRRGAPPPEARSDRRKPSEASASPLEIARGPRDFQRDHRVSCRLASAGP